VKTTTLGKIKSIALSLSIIISITAGNANASSQPSIAKEWWAVPVGLTWMWQLQDYENLKIATAYDVYDVDLFEASKGGKNSIIARLKSANKKVVCYFSAGTREIWRRDASEFSQSSMIYDGGMKDWPGEIWLDLSNLDALENSIKPIMTRRLELAAQSGCDGVEADNVDAYDNAAETHGLISPEIQLKYNRWLSSTAHKFGLAIGLKNDFRQLKDLVDDYDFAVSEQCYAYGIQCADYESTFLARNKAVFNQEYYTNGKEGELDEKTFTFSACTYFKSVGISSLWKDGYQLDGLGMKSCRN
jgi:hypothetical protein